MKTKNTYRILAAVLALLVLLGQLPAPARAAETTGLCEHHTAHEDCGYVEGDPGQPCTFQCDQCAQEPTTGAPDSCVCTGKCAAESANPDCPVCYADVTQCAGQETTPTATGIQVTTPPAKTQYQLQEPLDLTGGVLTVTYSDGSTQDMAITQDMVSGFKNDTACTLTLTVTWGGFEAYFDVTVLQPESDGGEGNQDAPPACNCESKCIAENTNQNCPVCSSDFAQCAGQNRASEVPSLYNDSVLVGDKSSILNGRVDMGNSKTVYLLHDSIELEGAVLYIEYSDENSETISITKDMIFDFDTATVGSKTFGIQYGDMQWYQSYEVVTRDMLEGPCGDDAYWYLSTGGQFTVWGTGEISRVNGDGIFGVPWERYKSLIKTIVIEDGITKIPGESFSNCTHLESVTLPASLVAIDSWAFRNCSRLTKIVIPKNVDSIGSRAFADCVGLTEITFESGTAPSTVGDRIFEGVTATAYFPATVYWSGYSAQMLFENNGGEIEWVAVGDVVESISLSFTYQELVVGQRIALGATGVPGYVAIDCEATSDSDVITIENDQNGRIYVTAQSPGTATITVREKRSGCSAEATILVKELSEVQNISCPYEESVPYRDNGLEYRKFTFTPEESGEYVISRTVSENYPAIIQAGPAIFVYDAESGEEIAPEEERNLIDSFNNYRNLYHLREGITYLIQVDIGGYEAVQNTVFQICLNKNQNIEGIEIIGENRAFYGAAGMELYNGSLFARLAPENAIGEITWESSNPEVIEVGGSGDLMTYGVGSAVLTARCGGHSDSITVNVQSPPQITLNSTIQMSSTAGEATYYAFTPTETGRYMFEYEEDLIWGDTGILGDYHYVSHTTNGNTNIWIGELTAGVTCYFLFSGYALGEERAYCSLTVKKEEASPAAMNVYCSGYFSDSIDFVAEFVPSNSFEEIISWESSAPKILDLKKISSSSSSATFNIYDTGEVTVTATSAGGLKASCTVTVGQCDSGHTYGPWRQTREPGCAIDGLETATCICGLRQYRSIPATGHTYDNNCDPDCNTCGETRTVEHSFSQSWAYSETAHWHVCTVCGERSQLENHVPGPAATQDSPQTCTLCGCVLKSALGHSHSYGDAWVCDDTGHWHACDGCSARKDYSGHVYTDACDPTCNICGYVRENIHISGGVLFSDRGGHWYTCTLCGTKLDHHAHEPGAAATATTPQLCAVCGYVLQKATGQTTTIIQQTVTNATGHTHRYDTRLTMDEDGHWYACSGCATRKDYERHRYTDDCDPDCAVCGYTRTVSHNAGAEWASDGTGHWYPCLDCGEKRNFAEHRMENGVCTVCGYAQQEEQPPAAQPPTEPTAPAAPDTGAGGDGTAGDQSQGLPWWMLLVAGLVSSAATLTIAGAVLWANRKKIAALFTGK